MAKELRSSQVLEITDDNGFGERQVSMTAASDPMVAAEPSRRGASGYVLKQSGTEAFVRAIRAVIRGELHLSSVIARETLDYLLHQSKRQRVERQITPAQNEILQLLARQVHCSSKSD